MKKKQSPFTLDPLVEFMVDHFTDPTKKEIDKFIKKIEQLLVPLKVPSKASFDQLTKRVEALEKAIKNQKRVKKGRPSAKPAKKASARKRSAPKTRSQMTDSEKVLQTIKKYKTGADMAKLTARTGFEDKKIRNIVFRLNKNGKVKRIGRGVYRAIV